MRRLFQALPVPGVLFLCLLVCSGPLSALTLVADGRPQAVVLTADEPSATTLQAAGELNYWIERITGTRLPQVAFGEWDGQGAVVAVGPSPFMQAEGIEVDHLAPEGARVVITDRYVALLGRDNPPLENLRWYGTYYAVLELVKRQFGVRVIWPGELGEVYPTAPMLTVTPGDWTWETLLYVRRGMRNTYTESAFASRKENLASVGMEASAEIWAQQGAQTEQWLQRQRMNAQASNITFGHSFTAWWDRYGEQHPEWFAHPPGDRQRPGGRGQKLCVSNEELRHQIIANWQAAWEANPVANKVLRAAPNDSRGFCTCPNCRAWDGPEQAHFTDMEIYTSAEPMLTERYVRFWNDLAERASAVEPDVIVTGYAYRNYRKPPVINTVHPAVMIGYVGGEGFYPHEEHLRDEWGRWAEAGARLLWRPNLLHCGHSMPYLFARQLGEDFKYFYANNMIGTDFDSLMGAWATQAPNYYILAELHSRPEADVEVLMDEFCAAFGEASAEVKEYFDYWERVTQDGPAMLEELLRPARLTWGQWTPGFIRLAPRLYTPGVLDQGEEILRRAETRVAGGDERVRARVAFLRLGFDHTRLAATALHELELLQGKDPAADTGRARAAAAALRAFRQANAGSIALPWYDMTSRELTYRETAPLHQGIEEETLGQALPEPWGAWKFRKDPENRGVEEEWFHTIPDNGEWTPVRVPATLAATDVGPYLGYGWYHTNFNVPREWAGQELLLHFGAVDEQAWVYLNGKYVGEHTVESEGVGIGDLWDKPFTIKLAPEDVRFGEENHLAVRTHASIGMSGIWGAVNVFLP